MYSKRQIIKGIKNPRNAARILLSNFAHSINRTFSRTVIDRIRRPINVFEEDWDNLLILDACTNELLQQYEFNCDVNDTRWSAGSHTLEFMRRNLGKRTLYDTVWVTANPQVAKFENQIFKIVHAWDSVWDEKLNTVPPGELSRLALKVANEYPKKRLVIHFVQPHYPFIGEFGREELPSHASFTVDGYLQNNRSVDRIWEQLEDGNVSNEAVRRAYQENLEIALPHVRELITQLAGRTVLTADHGNEFGNRAVPIPIKLFGHPEGYRTENLTRVPWIVFDGDNRKKIKAGEFIESNTDEKQIKKQLEYLGYK